MMTAMLEGLFSQLNQVPPVPPAKDRREPLESTDYVAVPWIPPVPLEKTKTSAESEKLTPPIYDDIVSEMVTTAKRAITCKTCINFESYQDKGGAGTCKVGVKPFGACWWADTLHSCDQYQSSVSRQGDFEPDADPLLVEVWTPSGTAMTIRADNAEHADWLRQMNPKPENPTPKPEPMLEHNTDRISEAVHNAQGRFFKFLVTRSDGTQFYTCSMPRMTIKEIRIQYHDAAAIEPVAGENYPND
jgi:hypothetical protein